MALTHYTCPHEHKHTCARNSRNTHREIVFEIEDNLAKLWQKRQGRPKENFNDILKFLFTVGYSRIHLPDLTARSKRVEGASVWCLKDR